MTDNPIVPLKNINITLKEDNGFCNATEMCKMAGKKWNHYISNNTTKEYLEALASETGIPASQLIISQKGNSGKFDQGTWVHPKVAIHLAQWLSPQFAVKVTNLVHDWMLKRAGVNPNQLTSNQCLRLRMAIKREAKGVSRNFSILYDHLHTYFGVNSYKDIPAEYFEDAINYIESMREIVKLFDEDEPLVKLDDIEEETGRVSKTIDDLKTITRTAALLIDKEESMPLHAMFKNIIEFQKILDKNYSTLENKLINAKQNKGSSTAILIKQDNDKVLSNKQNGSISRRGKKIIDLMRSEWERGMQLYTENGFASSMRNKLHISKTTINTELKNLIDNGHILKHVFIYRSSKKYMVLPDFILSDKKTFRH